MARAGLDHAAVVDGAVTLVNERGSEALTLAELAARLRVRTPSLYNHVSGLEGLRRDLTLRALQGLLASVISVTAGIAGREALAAMAGAYRSFGKANPGLYSFLVRTTEGADAEIQQVSAELMRLMLAILRGYNLPDGEAIHAARTVRSVVHGFVSLELGGGFGLPQDVDESFARLVDALHRALASWPHSPA